MSEELKKLGIAVRILYRDFCKKVKCVLGISSVGSASLFLNQQGEWVATGGGGGATTIVFTTVDNNNTYINAGLTSVTTAFVFYGQGILEPSQYTIVGNLITINPGFPVEANKQLIILKLT